MVPPHMVASKARELAAMKEKIEGPLPREATNTGDGRDSRGKGYSKGKDFKGKKGKSKGKGKDDSDESSEGSADPPR